MPIFLKHKCRGWRKMSNQSKKGRGPKNLKQTLGKLFQYLLMNKSRLFIVIVCLVISSFAGIAGTYFIRPLINDFIATKDVTGLFRMIVFIFCIYLIGVSASYTSSRLMIGIGQKTIFKMRTDLFNHMQQLPIRFFDTHKHGDLMSRFTNDFDSIQNMFNNSMLMLINSTLQVVLTFTMMVMLSPLLTVMIIIMVSLMVFIIKTVGKKSAAFFVQQQKTIGTLNGFIEEHIEGQKVIKAFHHESQTMVEFSKLNQELFESATKAQFFANMMMPILGNISYINYALTAMFGGLLTLNGGMDIGALASFLQYSRTFAQPLMQISQQTNVILSALAGAERIFEILDEMPEIDEGTVSLDVSNEHWFWVDGDHRIPVIGDIEMNQIRFGYDVDKPILKNISVWAKPGLKVAFVGATGAGKTTIINLINRFYDVDAGEIMFDTIPIKRIKKESLRQTISIVLQDTHLFTGTIADNIRYGRLNATDDDVIQAAKLVNAHSFIKRLPNGYQTELTGDGEGLSQGQRQLLAIARAAIADPKVLILDEATSSIDSHTESLITKGMDQLMKGRTSFVIAHRLSTIRNADVIMVMDHGEIIERGDHDSLMAKQGMYYKLYTGQIELD